MTKTDRLLAELQEIADTPVDLMLQLSWDDPRAKPTDFAKRCVDTGGKIYLEQGTGVVVFIGGDMAGWSFPPPGSASPKWQ